MVKNKPLFSDPQALTQAQLQWHQGLPKSVAYDDIYASAAGALEEKRHVFLQPNNLSARFSQLSAGQYFSLLELGFGSGCNFLLTWQLWQSTRETRPDSARLLYTSIEGHPQSFDDLGQCHSLWPELAPLAQQLQQQYPEAIKGYHVLDFDEVRLMLIQAPVDEALQQFYGRVDAIYLDGFSPAKNPQMWHQDTLGEIAKHCHSKTTFATYSVAHQVKDSLQKSGFSAATHPGFGRKRHQLSGLFAKANVKGKSAEMRVKTSPWQQLPPPLPAGAKIAVVGAGISGCTTALALQQRGYEVQLLDQADTIAAGASGNHQGMIYTKLPDSVTVAGQFHQQGLQYSMNLLTSLPANLWQACGLLQMGVDNADFDHMQKVVERGFPNTWLQLNRSKEGSSLSNSPVSGCLHLINSGWVRPAQWCTYYVAQLHHKPWLNTRLQSLLQIATGWELALSCTTGNGGANQIQYFDGVVLCNASQASTLAPELKLPLKPIRGQVTYVSGIEGPPAVICGDGYVTPKQGNIMTVGASYNLHSEQTSMNDDDHQANLARLRQILPQTTPNQCRIEGGRVSFRASTPDYLPMVGALVDAEQTLSLFDHLRKDKNYRFTTTMPWLSGLYINAGHGSKGLLTAPLSSQLLAAQISGEVLPMSKTISDALSANRFLLRDMMRNKR